MGIYLKEIEELARSLVEDSIEVDGTPMGFFPPGKYFGYKILPSLDPNDPQIDIEYESSDGVCVSSPSGRLRYRTSLSKLLEYGSTIRNKA